MMLGSPFRSRQHQRAAYTNRRLQIECLEARHVLDGGLVALANDAFDLRENGPQTLLDVLSNDTFDSQYGGAQRITSVSYGSEGGRIAIAADQRSILYTPPADFFGVETFVYAVDGRFTAEVTVGVQAPLAFDDYVIPPDGLVHELGVLESDLFWPGYSGGQQITAVSVGSAGGEIVIAPDGQSVLYTPPGGAFGKETFIYVVDDLYPAEVTIQIPQTLLADEFEVVQHAPPQVFHVLANDPFWANYPGPGRITHATAPQLGTVAISSDGQSVIYTPSGGNAWDSFRYVVDGEYEASVTVRIHRPVRDDSFEVDRNTTGYYYNVLANDTYFDLNNVPHDVVDQVTSVTQPASGGVVTIAAGGQGVYYTPPADFYGTDTFTYLADGVHQATARVQVTRPVRDDYIAAGVYQDTPDGLLDVLANDFIGNGYSGPGLITAVGPTDNGGQLTISDNGKTLFYTSADGFTGYDHFSYTVDGELSANVTVYVRPLAVSDTYGFSGDPPRGPYSLSVLSNDNFQHGYTGPGVITAATVYIGSGQVSIQNGQSLSFTPGASRFNYIRYTVDD
ncbi:MAG: hypothetical protein KDA37_13000, partial [Planctomycetales bacterium]|nr:hypothetical protein [Planctomycetales bacterium]